MNTIGENIKAARKALRMSQDALAEAIGANRVTISKYENGGYLPSVPALERLADALHTTPEELSGRDPGIKKEPAASGRREEAVVKKYRQLTPDQQKQADLYLDFLIASQDKKDT